MSATGTAAPPGPMLSRRALVGATLAMPATAILASATARAGPSKPAMKVRRLLWAGILLEVGDVAVFIDAVPPETNEPAPTDLFDTAKAQRFAIVTHYHGDHFDHDLVQQKLGANGTLIAPREAAMFMDLRSLKVQTVETWQPVFLPRNGADVVAWPVPAVDGFGAPQSSWILDGAGRRIFHGGDTQWHGNFSAIGRAYGPFDAAFLPINGARQNVGRFVDAGVPAVLTPEQAIIAAEQLRAKLIVPIHYGGNDPPSYLETDHPLERLQASATARRLPVKILKTGEVLTL